MPLQLEKIQHARRPCRLDTNPDFRGAYAVRLPCGTQVVIICSVDNGTMEHVSVVVHCPEIKGQRRAFRNPTWNEMCEVKNLVWEAEDTVIQIHPPQSEYVNLHDYCLHMWRAV